MVIAISTLEMVGVSSRQIMEKLFLLLTYHHGKTFKYSIYGICSMITVVIDFFVGIDFLLLIFTTTHSRNLRPCESLLKGRNT